MVAEWRQQALHRACLDRPTLWIGTSGCSTRHPDLAMVGPVGMILQSTYYWGVRENAVSNRGHVRALAARLGIDAPSDDFHFVAGSMFWLRPSAVSGLLDLRLSDEEFEVESGQRRWDLGARDGAVSRAPRSEQRILLGRHLRHSLRPGDRHRQTTQCGLSAQRLCISHFRWRAYRVAVGWSCIVIRVGRDADFLLDLEMSCPASLRSDRGVHG